MDLRESHGVMPDVGWGGAILTDVDRLSVAYPTERVDARWILEMRVEFFPNTGYAQVCRLRFQPFKLRGIGATLDLLQFSPVTRKTITRIADVNHYSACGGRKSYHAHSVYSALRLGVIVVMHRRRCPVGERACYVHVNCRLMAVVVVVVSRTGLDMGISVALGECVAV